TTTTSSKEDISSVKATLITVLPATGILCDSNPINEKTKVDPSGTAKEYLPPRSVAVPTVVPGNEIVTPGRGSPLASVTIPVTVTSPRWAIFTDFPFSFLADIT